MRAHCLLAFWYCEVMFLLVLSGAGKTTAFSVLTGDISMSSGTAVIAGYDIRTHPRNVSKFPIGVFHVRPILHYCCV